MYKVGDRRPICSEPRGKSGLQVRKKEEDKVCSRIERVCHWYC